MIAGDWSYWRLARNVGVLAFTAVLFVALPEARCIVNPPAAPPVVPPSGWGLEGKFWISIKTDRPGCFCVRLVSGYWAYRNVDVEAHSGAGRGSPRGDPSLRTAGSQDRRCQRWRHLHRQAEPRFFP
jgi:hypothetical protein